MQSPQLNIYFGYQQDKSKNNKKIILNHHLSYHLSWSFDPIYTGLVIMVQVLYLLEICCLGLVFIILYDDHEV